MLLAVPVEVTDLQDVTISATRGERLPTKRVGLSDAEVELLLPLPEQGRRGTPYVRDPHGLWWPVDEPVWRYLLTTACPDAEQGGSENDAGHAAARPAPGWLYIMACPALGADVWKVGRTARDPRARAAELSGETGVAQPFLVIEAWRCTDMATGETAVHAALKPYRINPRREFFRLPYASLRQVVISVVPESGSDTGGSAPGPDANPLATADL